MIHDHLDHAPRYATLHPRLTAWFEYLRTTDFAAIETGHYRPFPGEDFIKVERYTTREPVNLFWESHRHYIDIQCIIDGREQVRFTTLETAPQVKAPYDAEKDLIIYDEATVGSRADILARHFALFFPSDVHAPGLAVDSPEPILKATVKLAID